MTTATEQAQDHAQRQAAAQYAHIEELIEALEAVQQRGGEPVIIDGEPIEDEDDVRERIDALAVSAEVRSGWTMAGGELEADEYQIALCVGGPAVRVYGALDAFGEPHNARIEYRDWAASWRAYAADVDEQVLLDFARQFYFGG